MAGDHLLGTEGMRVILEPIPGVTGEAAFGKRWPFFVFQCPPLEEFAVEQAFSYNDYETIGDGQFSRKGGLQLATVSFDTLIVEGGSYTLYDRNKVPGGRAPDPETQIDILQKLLKAGEPFLFTAAHALPPKGYDSWDLTQIGPEVQMAATMRTLRIGEKAGEGDARYISASFTEYREAVVGTKKVRKKGKKAKKLVPDKPKMKPNGLMFDKRGIRIGNPPMEPVTLARLARHYYKDAQKWRKIAARNGLGSWGQNHALTLHPKYKGKGGTIVIPK